MTDRSRLQPFDQQRTVQHTHSDGSMLRVKYPLRQ